MTWIGTAGAVALIVFVLVDTFEAMILPRRIAHPFRPARLFYQLTWAIWRWIAVLLPAAKARHGFLSIYGPLSVFALVSMWVAGLVVGFALLHWSLGTTLTSAGVEYADFSSYVYFSGTTFFTLGYGDLVPTGTWGRVLSVVEAGVGFGFLAVVISFLPVLYQAFSRREITISLLDARAGSPPCAGELLRRLAESKSITEIRPLLVEWERWSAELLESHLSYPMLRFYRSQHDNQSWLATLTTILDTSALLIAAVDGADGYQGRLTFAMARHAAVDLSLVSQTPPLPPNIDRLSTADFARLQSWLASAGLPMRDGPAVVKALTELRELYEPFVNALATHFVFALPAFQPQKPPVDNWQTSAWTRRSPDLGALPAGTEDDHFN